MSDKEKLPQVDAARIRSSASISALRDIMREPLFIPREPIPDFGVDFNAEVMTDDHQATNWHLSIQLRSEDPPRYVAEGAAISVRFKTSALNYLFRGLGRSIVVAYDVPGKKL